MNRQRSPIAASRYQWLAKLSLRDRKQTPTSFRVSVVYGRRPCNRLRDSCF
jgi:hypothetical protein